MHTPAFTHAGGIVLRPRSSGSGAFEVLVVRPSVPEGDEWVLPKGHIEPGEEAPEAAVREVLEEAGAVCKGPRFVGFVSYRAKGEDVVCAFYRMDLQSLGDSEEDRGRAWLTLPELERTMPYPESLELVSRAARLQ